MDTELCVYLGAGRFTIIISVHFHDNWGSQYGAKYDDKLMHTNIVLHGSVVKQWGLSPHHIYSGPRPLLRQPENQHQRPDPTDRVSSVLCKHCFGNK